MPMAFVAEGQASRPPGLGIKDRCKRNLETILPTFFRYKILDDI